MSAKISLIHSYNKVLKTIEDLGIEQEFCISFYEDMVIVSVKFEEIIEILSEMDSNELRSIGEFVFIEAVKNGIEFHATKLKEDEF